MGYEIAGGLGVKIAEPDREVVVLVGDGSYLMMAQELVTSIQEGLRLVVVLVQNHGFASIGGLSRSVGSAGFGTSYRFRTGTAAAGGRLDGAILPVDLAANAASLGATVVRVGTTAELRTALTGARVADRTTVIHVETDPEVAAPDSESWWDVPVAQTATVEATVEARRRYDEQRVRQRPLLRPPAAPEP
jgi:3D-(3,5/4)-trihydroxycyclohexane-1,2-dione acylhydrolase (decyclizing)